MQAANAIGVSRTTFQSRLREGLARASSAAWFSLSGIWIIWTEGRTMATPNQKRGAAALVAAALIATPFIGKLEGKRNDPYLDSQKILTVCMGETRVEMRRYSDAECKAMLDAAITNDFGPRVLACTPGIADKPRVLASAISLSYNIGSAGYCRSTAARKFNAGDIRGGCNAFMLWDRPREIIGRRKKERDLCLSGVAP